MAGNVSMMMFALNNDPVDGRTTTAFTLDPGSANQLTRVGEN